MGSTKALVVDISILSKLNLSIEQFVYLHNIYVKYKININIRAEEITQLQEELYTKTDENSRVHLRQKAIDLIEFFTIDSFKNYTPSKKIVKKSKKKINAEVKERVSEYRELWRGRKAGSMGDAKSCIEKLSRWMDENPEHSFDDVLRAANLYLNTEGRNTQFLQKANFFIFKQNANKEEESRLSAYIDELDSGIDEEWTTKVI